MNQYEITRTVLNGLGMLGNGTLLLVIARFPLKSAITTYLLLALCFVDHMVCVMGLIDVWVPNPGKDDPYLARVLCCFLVQSLYLYFLFLFMSFSNMACLAVERYLAIVKPTVYTGQKRWIFAGCVTFNLILPLLTAWPIVLSVSMSRSAAPTCKYQALWPSVIYFEAFLLVVMIWFIPSVTAFFCYGKIAHVLYTRRRSVQPSTKGYSSDSSSRAPLHKSTIRFTQVMMSLSAIHVACVSFFTVVLICDFLSLVSISKPLYEVTKLAINIISTINPYVTVAVLKAFREKLGKFVICFKKAGDNSQHAGKGTPAQGVRVNTSTV
jgi:hypothetical protein